MASGNKKCTYDLVDIYALGILFMHSDHLVERLRTFAHNSLFFKLYTIFGPPGDRRSVPGGHITMRCGVLAAKVRRRSGMDEMRGGGWQNESGEFADLLIGRGFK